ncbi:hypothetical protein VMCG_06489 [Cytospora schulzeri]|uniref:Uncharacterized protein n=1 Tax=Cytospora schulzeri TaxID=448051 RepID=A0A423WBU7_9PEZI|nr:hypothetical protein VMCG_06489 [Valsa malicola]
MPRFTITEPHPTIRTNTYTQAGRGGAGNIFRAPPTTSPAGVPTPLNPISPVTSNTTVSSTSSTRFYSGRGGAGNAHFEIERPTIDFEDEFSRADLREQLDYGHYVGRGGAGNFSSSGKKSRKGSEASAESNASTSSGISVKAAFRNLVHGIMPSKH